MQEVSAQGAWLLRGKATLEWVFIASPPLVDAWWSASRLHMWCDHCLRWHHHTAEEGHRHAHCVVENSPYHLTGYVLRRNTQDPRPRQRDRQAKRCTVCHRVALSALIVPRLCRACTAQHATPTPSAEPARL